MITSSIANSFNGAKHVHWIKFIGDVFSFFASIRSNSEQQFSCSKLLHRTNVMNINNIESMPEVMAYNWKTIQSKFGEMRNECEYENRFSISISLSLFCSCFCPNIWILQTRKIPFPIFVWINTKFRNHQITLHFAHCTMLKYTYKNA